MRRSIFIILTLILLTSSSAFAQKEKRTKTKKQMKEQVQKEGDQRSAISAAYGDGVDRHKTIQDKKTKKRMKRNQKRLKKKAKGREIPFYKRWFRKSHFR